jgi:hypothetical protein
MPTDYAPKLFLRQAENVLLREYFTARGELADIKWESLQETDVDPIYDAWQALPENKQEQVEQDFRDIFDLASEEGVQTLIDEGRFHDLDLAIEIGPLDGLLNKAFLVYLKHKKVFEVAHILDRTDHLNARYWRMRKDFLKKQPDISASAIAELGQAIGAYYSKNQGRGKWCKVENYLQSERYHYFFAYPKDYTDTFVGYDERGEFQRRPQNPAFEVIFIYDQKDGTLELYAQGDKYLKQDLQTIFARAILHGEIGPEDRNSVPYELEGLKNRDFVFPTDPVDAIDGVRVRELRLSMVGNARQRIIFEASPSGPQTEVYDLVEQSLHEQRLPMSMLNVTSVVIQMRFKKMSGKGNLTKTLSFRISLPDSCNLKDKPEHLVAKRYLKEWKLANV